MAQSSDGEVQILFTIHALLHYLHVQQPQEDAVEANAQGRLHLQSATPEKVDMQT